MGFFPNYRHSFLLVRRFCLRLSISVLWAVLQLPFRLLSHAVAAPRNDHLSPSLPHWPVLWSDCRLSYVFLGESGKAGCLSPKPWQICFQSSVPSFWNDGQDRNERELAHVSLGFKGSFIGLRLSRVAGTYLLPAQSDQVSDCKHVSSSCRCCSG